MHRVVTPPANEPINLDEAKAQCRVDGDYEDALLTAYIQAAREHGEGMAERAFITQTIEAVFPRFPSPGWPVMLPRPPLLAVESVTYTDSAGEEQVLDHAAYAVDTVSEPGRITPVGSWPVSTNVRVRYTAGYGDEAEDVPQCYRQGIRLLVGHWYANRESVVIGTIATNVPQAADALFGYGRIYRVPT
jgi:uncharacterized phiE125 gp8 family phage protein